MISLTKQVLGLGIMLGALLAGPGVALADQTHQLGASWPAATDVSRVPGYHVYRFDQDGVKYIQVNGADGSVLAAVAATNSTILPLPMGGATVRVSTASALLPMSGTPSVTVYADGSTQILVGHDAHGASTFTAASSTDGGGGDINHGL